MACPARALFFLQISGCSLWMVCYQRGPFRLVKTFSSYSSLALLPCHALSPPQVAALIECQLCVGIEKAKIPSDKAVNMDQLFRMWMGWYGKKYSPYRLYQVPGKSSV